MSVSERPPDNPCIAQPRDSGLAKWSSRDRTRRAFYRSELACGMGNKVRRIAARRCVGCYGRRLPGAAGDCHTPGGTAAGASRVLASHAFRLSLGGWARRRHVSAESICPLPGSTRNESVEHLPWKSRCVRSVGRTRARVDTTALAPKKPFISSASVAVAVAAGPAAFDSATSSPSSSTPPCRRVASPSNSRGSAPTCCPGA
jgi:hypothetical protein